MKKLVLGLAALTFGLSTFAQVDRSKAPTPAPAPKIQINKAETFELANGLKVILVENHKRPTISVQLNVDYTPFLENEVAGNASLAGQLLRNGTANRTKAQIDETVDFLGATLSTSANGIYASSLTKHSGQLMEIVSDIILNPTFPQEELDKLKKQTLSNLKSNKDDASAIAANVTKVMRYGKNHPYGEVETEETVANITQETCKKFFNTYFKPNVSYLVIVGDIKKADAQKMAEKYFGKWAKGSVPTATLPKVEAPTGVQVCFVPKTGAVQSVINVTYPVDLKPGSDNAIKASVMNSILGGGIFSGRLMQNLREDKAYTYGARSSLSSDKYVGSFTAYANVRNEVTDSSVTEFLFEMDRMVKQKVSADDLSLTLNSMNGSFARNLESPQTIARFALNTIKYNLPADYYQNYLSNLSAVTIDDVQNVAKQYIQPKNTYVVVVGNKEIAETLAKFDADGEVTYYDIYGNEGGLVEMKPAPEGVTAQNVLDKYVMAFTETSDMKSAGKKLKKLKDITTKATSEIQGFQIELNTYQKAPNKYAMNVVAMGNIVQKQKFNGTVGKSVSPQGSVTMEGEELEQMKMQATMNAESKLAELGYTVELLGIEEVEGNDAYVLKMSKGDDSSQAYYDVATGLKVKTVTVGKNPQTGEAVTSVATNKDYKSVDGYKFAFTRDITGVQPLTLTVKSIEINTKLGDDLFE